MPRRNKYQREKDLIIIADRYLKGDFQAEIAEDLGVSQRTISKDLQELQKRWLKSALVNYDHAIAKELAAVDHLERVYWEAWEVSQGADSGDPRFLKGVEWCIEKRCKLLGLDAPEKIDARHFGKEGEPPIAVKSEISTITLTQYIEKKE